MGITSYTGEQLLQKEVLEAIKKEADLLLQNKDVAGTWQASRHIKAQLGGLPGEKVKPVLGDYRRLTANLKALALPLLGWDEVKTLITNNLSFLEERYLSAAGASLNAWLATQADGEKEARRAELLKLLPSASALRKFLSVPANPPAAPAPAATAERPAVKISNHEGYFDKDEAAELADHAQKVSAIGGAPLGLAGGATAAENIFALSGGKGDKDTFLRRANALITSRLRDVRTKTDLRGYLGRPFKVGGLGLSAEMLDQASNVIEDEYNKLHSGEPKMPQPQAAIAKAVAAAVMEAPLPARDATESFAGGPARPASQVAAEASAPPLPAVKEESAKPAPQPAITIAPVAPKIEPKPTAKIEPVPDAVRVVRPVRIAPGGDKPRLEDIKATPRTTSAVDELKLLTIEDWRQYGSPDEAVKNILEKVELLGKESIAAKGQGIKMFRESALFRQYVALGRATLAQGKKLADALTDKAVNPDNMTQDEFFAIALLNGKLK